MVIHLDEAGYNVGEIAQIVGHPPEVVRSLLKKAA
jgi:DNA-directed RNA polymerase specialized sigma24 family protein